MMALRTFWCSAGIVAPNRSRYSGPYGRNTSATVGIGLLRHQLVDGGPRLFLAQGSQMEIDHRRLQGTVTQILLDQSQVDPRFEPVRRVTMSQSVDCDPLAESQLFHHAFHHPVNAGARHRFGGRVASAWSRPVAGNNQVGWRCVTQYWRSIVKVRGGSGT